MNLTARQAAERLNVPHPHLLILLSEGEIPSRKIGRHRFVREEDLLDYKAKRDAERRRILDKMVRDAEEAGLYGERGRLLTACEGTGKEFNLRVSSRCQAGRRFARFGHGSIRPSQISRSARFAWAHALLA